MGTWQRVFVAAVVIGLLWLFVLEPWLFSLD
jgi:hypothetical protein